MAVQLVLIADSSIPEATLRASTSTAVETLNLSQATSPAPMSSAPFVWRQDGRPDWRAMWSDFCGLALFGGPPHRVPESVLRAVTARSLERILQEGGDRAAGGGERDGDEAEEERRDSDRGETGRAPSRAPAASCRDQ